MTQPLATSTIDQARDVGFRRIVVGIDGSELSRAAFACSTMIAQAAGIEIHAIHVLESLHGDGTCLPWDPALIERHASVLGVRLHDGPSLRDGGLTMARATIDECRNYCLARSIQFSSGFMFGPLIDRLLESTATDLLAVGKGRFGHAGYGSTTRRLMQHAPCPVLIVSGPLRPINRVVGVFDGAAASQRAIDVSRTLAKQTNWPLTILAVASHVSLSEALDSAQLLAPNAQVIATGEAGHNEALQIERVAASIPYGLMIVPAFSDTWLQQTMQGGMTGHLLAHLDAPVVLVH